MSERRLSANEVARFQSDGYLHKPALFDADEVALMRRALDSDEGFGDQRNFMAMHDADGSVTTTVLWTDPGEDLFGAVARCERVVEGAERLLGGEVYHYHSKLTLKAPGTGGAWNWHQDYGYWYFNGNLFPDMLSVFIAIDPATRENGCLQVIRGSARMGRLDHELVGGQLTAEPERVEHALQRLDVVSCEMDAGDALFLHCNTLHGSSKNTSRQSRNVLLCCYNAAANDPYKDHHMPRYTPLHKLPDSAVKARGGVHAGAARRFMRPDASCAPTITRRTRRRFPRPTHPERPAGAAAPENIRDRRCTERCTENCRIGECTEKCYPPLRHRRIQGRPRAARHGWPCQTSESPSPPTMRASALRPTQTPGPRQVRQNPSIREGRSWRRRALVLRARWCRPKTRLADVIVRISDPPQTRLHEIVWWNWKTYQQRVPAA